MTVEIKPSSPKGTVTAPPSKSMAHRLLICAALSKDKSVISNIAYSKDITATLYNIIIHGIQIKNDETSVTVWGRGAENISGGTFYCKESGSTLRFFIPLAALSPKEALFTGYGRLMERPMEVYEELFREKGLFYEKNEKGISLSGVLEGGDFTLRGDVSSQFVTGLMLALPNARKDSRIILTGKPESTGYIDMTVDALSKFGIEINKISENEYYIKGSQEYRAGDFTVEGDYSNAAFLDAFALLGADLKVDGLSSESLQPDRAYKEYFALLKEGTPTLDVSQCPDLAPVLMALASALNGARLTGTKRLKMKESDRGEVMKQELCKFGAVIEIKENEIIISKSTLHAPTQKLSGHNDHRVVMSLAVLCSIYGGVIEESESVKKSYPDFFEVMKKAGLEVTEYGD